MAQNCPKTAKIIRNAQKRPTRLLGSLRCWVLGRGHVKWCHEVAKLGVPGVLPFPSPPVLGGRKNGAVEKRNRAVVEKQLGHGRTNWAVEDKNGTVEKKMDCRRSKAWKTGS